MSSAPEPAIHLAHPSYFVLYKAAVFDKCIRRDRPDITSKTWRTLSIGLNVKIWLYARSEESSIGKSGSEARVRTLDYEEGLLVVNGVAPKHRAI